MSSTMAWVVYAGGYVAGAIWVALVHWYYRRKYRSRYFPIRPYIRKRALIISLTSSPRLKPGDSLHSPDSKGTSGLS